MWTNCVSLAGGAPSERGAGRICCGVCRGEAAPPPPPTFAHSSDECRRLACARRRWRRVLLRKRRATAATPAGRLFCWLVRTKRRRTRQQRRQVGTATKRCRSAGCCCGAGVACHAARAVRAAQLAAAAAGAGLAASQAQSSANVAPHWPEDVRRAPLGSALLCIRPSCALRVCLCVRLAGAKPQAASPLSATNSRKLRPCTFGTRPTTAPTGRCGAADAAANDNNNNNNNNNTAAPPTEAATSQHYKYKIGALNSDSTWEEN